MSTDGITIIMLRYYLLGRFCACFSTRKCAGGGEITRLRQRRPIPESVQELPLFRRERVGVRVNYLTISSTASIEAGLARRLRPTGAKAGMVVQVSCVVLVLTAQHAMSTDFAHRVPVGELRMRNVARRAVGPLATRAAVAIPVACTLPGLGSRL